MDQLCPEPPFASNITEIHQQINNVSHHSYSNDTLGNITMDAHSGGSQNGFHSNNEEDVTYEFVTMHIVIPVVCSFGLLGNLLALVVLLRRVNEGGIEMLEKGSLVGMIGRLIND